MKNLSISVFFLFVLTTNIQAQWQKIETLPINLTYYGGCIDALGDDFAVLTKAIGQILITKDAGKTWTTINLPQAEVVVDIFLVSKNIFYIATTSNLGTTGNFYKTTDGGNTWVTIFSNPSLTSFGNYIEMFSETKGIAMGDGPFISHSPNVLSNQALFLKTTTGTDWQQINFQDIGWSGDTWRRMDFVDENNGYFYRSGISPEKLLKTTDGGATWTNTNFRVNGRGWMVKFHDKDYGLVYDYDYLAGKHLVDRTTNGGADWQNINTTGMGRVNDIEFVPSNPSNVWLGASNVLYFSADSGKTWIQKFSAERFDDIVFPTAKTGWALTTGNLYYTNNGGLISSAAQEINLPTNFELYQNYPNPFNPETAIRYQLSEFGFVTLKVYDILGREVAVLVNEFQQSGIHNSTFNINNYSLPSGTYFYRLTAGDFSSTQKMVLLK